MAKLSACMRLAPCSTAAGATASRLRWAAVAARVSRCSTTAAARAVRCRASRQHDFSLRPAPHTHQGIRARWNTACAAADQLVAPAPQQQAAAPSSRGEHNKALAEAFSDPAAVQHSLQPLDSHAQLRLERIVEEVPNLGPASRVIIVGCGTGALIPSLQELGVRDILAVDLAQPMLDALTQRFSPPSTLGDQPGVRTWYGDIVDLPAAEGPADAVFFDACFGFAHDQHAALWAACRLLRPGGHIVISRPASGTLADALWQQHATQLPHTLPDANQMQRLIHDLPLRLVDTLNSEPVTVESRVLQVPEGYVFDNMFYNWQVYDTSGGGRSSHGPDLRREPKPVCWKAKVVQGFGRGSRDLGFPTANLDPEDCRTRVKAHCFDLEGGPGRVFGNPGANTAMPKGVYFGFAKLSSRRRSQGLPAGDGAVHGMVMNIGERPTMADGGGVTVEVHVFDHKFSSDFYGLDMTVLICGFLRPEMKFDGLPALMAQIRTDIGIARSQLALPRPQRWRQARFKDGTAPPKATLQQAAKQPAVRQQEAAVSPKQPADNQQEAAVSRAQQADRQQEAAVSPKQPADTQQEAAVSRAQQAVRQQEAAMSRAQQAVRQQEAAVSRLQPAVGQQEAAVSRPELLSRLPAEEMRNIYRVDIAISRLDAETNGQQPESIEQIVAAAPDMMEQEVHDAVTTWQLATLVADLGIPTKDVSYSALLKRAVAAALQELHSAQRAIILYRYGLAKQMLGREHTAEKVAEVSGLELSIVQEVEEGAKATMKQVMMRVPDLHTTPSNTQADH